MNSPRGCVTTTREDTSAYSTQNKNIEKQFKPKATDIMKDILQPRNKMCKRKKKGIKLSVVQALEAY
jgi:hypothetical protein